MNETDTRAPDMCVPEWVRRARAIVPYRPARHPAPMDLDLSGATSFGDGGPVAYPLARVLEAQLAARFGVSANRVLVTAGSDEALDRACRVALTPGRNAIVTDPTFEMIPRCVALAGSTTRSIPWSDGPFPVDAAIAAADRATTLVAVVTPNNPTGTVATCDDIRRLHDALPHALIVADLAYIEYADTDPTPQLLNLPRLIVMRTFSKAWAMPDVRVGYTLGAPEVIAALRNVGGPFPVADASLAAALAALATEEGALRARVENVRRHRDALTAWLRDGRCSVPNSGNPGAGVVTTPSQAGFVCLTGARVEWVHDALAGLGIATRLLTTSDATRLRITVPPDAATFTRLRDALTAALSPEAVLFDMDGVLADVRGSYHEAIRSAAASFGVTLRPDAIAARKAAGAANDDWALTAELIEAQGVACAPRAVADAFERAYQGSEGIAGLRERESLLVSRGWLRALAARLPLAVVTGRPRADAERFLTRVALDGVFAVVVAREDAPSLKPSPEPVCLALQRLGVRHAWMIGDTPDDIVAARRAGVVPIGVASPGISAMREALSRAGAARVVTNAMEIASCLP